MSNRVTLFFRANSGYGWSESYYTSATGSLLTTQISALISRRMQLSGTDVSCTHARINTGSKRLVQVLTAGGGSGIQGSQPTPTCAEEVALTVLLQATTFQYNRKFLRGIPERVVSENTFVPDSPYTTVLSNYLTFLTSSGFSIQGRLGKAGPVSPILTLTPTPPRGVNLTVDPTFGPVNVGDLVKIAQVAIPGYNGFKVVQKVTAGASILIMLGGAAPAATPPVGQGIVTPYLAPFDLGLATAVVEGVTRRAAGRFFGLSLGRRKTLYSLRR